MSTRVDPRALVAALVLALMLTGAWWGVSAYLPKPRPWEVVPGSVQSWQDGPFFRVRVGEVRVTQECGYGLADRYFRDTITDAVFRQKAVKAPFDATPIVPVHLDVGVHKNLEWAWIAVPGRKGTFQFMLSLSDCDEGFNDTYQLYFVPYDWTNLQTDPPAPAERQE